MYLIARSNNVTIAQITNITKLNVNSQKDATCATTKITTKRIVFRESLIVVSFVKQTSIMLE